VTPSALPASNKWTCDTLNDGYARTRSQVWVREVARPTRAALDYAAYHANFMIADPEPETPLQLTSAPDTSHPFAGMLEQASLTGDIAKTSLSPSERRQALAFAPLSEFLQAHKVAGAEALAAVGSAVRSEKWGLQLPPGTSGQLLSELFRASGGLRRRAVGKGRVSALVHAICRIGGSRR
jgi:alginate O-acetyltransferase complex protein AlgJ